MIQFVQSLIFILLIAKSMCDQSDEGVKYASKCEGLYDS
jgi:hypothetical protein